MNHSPLTFLEATKLLKEPSNGTSTEITLCTSGTSAQLEVFLRAEATRRDCGLQIKTLPFGTLAQHLFSTPPSPSNEVFILYPWDLAGDLDWRSGVVASESPLPHLRTQAERFMKQLHGRAPLAVLYVPAPTPPIGLTGAESKAFQFELSAIAAAWGAQVLEPGLFALGSYLGSGSPLASSKLGTAAMYVLDAIERPKGEPKKVLVTDLDNTLWAGVIGEDGIDGIAHSSDGRGFKHFIYQTMLRKLKGVGILLAVVSRNDADVVAPALAPGKMILRESDFVSVLASYEPKSSQIIELSRRLNLGLDHFVFVDDNPIELEEVRGAAPRVTCLPFPAEESQLITLIDELQALFSVTSVTTEDRQRTALYQRLMTDSLPVEGEAYDLTDFLSGLGMRLTIRDRSTGDRTRAVQLINKTNQFNLNGQRWTDEEIQEVLSGGGRLYTAALADRAGEHGEILACLVNCNAQVEAFVLSCRVFQRRVEHMFLLWLLDIESRNLRFSAKRTERNTPLWQFISAGPFEEKDGTFHLEREAFFTQYKATQHLFSLPSEEDN